MGAYSRLGANSNKYGTSELLIVLLLSISRHYSKRGVFSLNPYMKSVKQPFLSCGVLHVHLGFICTASRISP